MSGPGDEQLWAAVTEPARRRLLDVLVAHGEATPTALAAELPFTRQAVSKHLAVLRDAGLVSQRREGREVRYAIEPDRLHAAARAMVAAANRWTTRLQAVRRIAETLHQAETAAGEPGPVTGTTSSAPPPPRPTAGAGSPPPPGPR